MTKPLSPSRSFASDNNAGVHPEIIEAVARANAGHVVAYGDDPYTARAVKTFEQHLGRDIAVYFVFGGTGANVLGLKAITKSYQAVVCASTAHINVDECGAPEKFTGCKLLSVESPNGKITTDHVNQFLHAFGNEHHVQPRVISVSQSTEMGTVYTQRELKTLSAFRAQEQHVAAYGRSANRKRRNKPKCKFEGDHGRTRVSMFFRLAARRTG